MQATSLVLVVIDCLECLPWAKEKYLEQQVKQRAEQDKLNQELLLNCQSGKVMSCPIFCRKNFVNYPKLLRAMRKTPLTPAGFINHPKHGKYAVYFVSDLMKIKI